MNKNNEVLKEDHLLKYVLSAISHDIITPLTSIRANAEFLEDGLSAEQRLSTSSIIKSVDQIDNMIVKLKKYTLIKSGDYKLSRTVVDGREFFDSIIVDSNNFCLQKDVNFLPSINILGNYKLDTKMIKNLVDELMENAIRHTPVRGNLWLSVSLAKEGLPKWVFNKNQIKLPDYCLKNGILIIVQNDGMGIDEDKQKLVFKPFYQCDHRSKNNGQGFGLGLSICDLVVEKHEGNIYLFSSKLNGSSIVVWLPSLK